LPTSDISALKLFTTKSPRHKEIIVRQFLVAWRLGGEIF